MSVEVQLNSGVVAFGMSITMGLASLNTPNYWVNRVAGFIGGPVENRAISGTGLPSMVAQSNAYAPYSGRTKLGLIDGPLNDVRQDGAGCLPSVKPSLDAMISNLFSGYFRGPAWSSPIVKTGVWSNVSSSYGGRSLFFGLNAMSTIDSTASIEIPFTGPIVCIHGFASEGTDWGDWDVSIDGTPWGYTEWAGKANPGSGRHCVATVVDGLTNGAHTLCLTPRGTATLWALDGIQCPMLAAPVSLGSVPNIANWAFGGAIGTWADAQAVNLVIHQVANEWSARGYPVGFADVAAFIDPARDFVGGDGVHPPDRGHINWSLAYLASIRISP